MPALLLRISRLFSNFSKCETTSFQGYRTIRDLVASSPCGTILHPKINSESSSLYEYWEHKSNLERGAGHLFFKQCIINVLEETLFRYSWYEDWVLVPHFPYCQIADREPAAFLGSQPDSGAEDEESNVLRSVVRAFGVWIRGIRGSTDDGRNAARSGNRQPGTSDRRRVGEHHQRCHTGDYSPFKYCCRTLQLPRPTGRHLLDYREKDGFQKVVRSGIQIFANQVTEVNITLPLGSVSSTIEVTGSTPLVQTGTSQISNDFNSRQVTQLPNPDPTGSQLQLALLAPGTTSQQAGVLGEGGSIGGTRPRMNSFTIDGVDDNRIDLTGHTQYVIPEAVSDFNLLRTSSPPNTAIRRAGNLTPSQNPALTIGTAERGNLTTTATIMPTITWKRKTSMPVARSFPSRGMISIELAERLAARSSTTSYSFMARSSGLFRGSHPGRGSAYGHRCWSHDAGIRFGHSGARHPEAISYRRCRAMVQS